MTQEPLPRQREGLILGPHGPLRARASVEFREQVGALLDEGLVALVLDFAGVDYIDSSTAGFLLNVSDRLRDQGGALALARLPGAVQVVIDSIGLTSFFTVCETLEDAIAEVDE